jgi:hypothetical protein
VLAKALPNAKVQIDRSLSYTLEIRRLATPIKPSALLRSKSVEPTSGVEETLIPSK